MTNEGQKLSTYWLSLNLGPASRRLGIKGIDSIDGLKTIILLLLYHVLLTTDQLIN